MQTTKQAFAYVFNRETGEPIWPIEEHPVPRGHVPGEWYSPTQPFPTKPAAYDLQDVTEDDLIDFTPELREAALAILNQYEYGSMYTPPLHPGNDLRMKGALHCPGPGGGSNITGGTAADPETGILYVASMTRCAVPVLIPGERGGCPESESGRMDGRQVRRQAGLRGGTARAPAVSAALRPDHGDRHE